MTLVPALIPVAGRCAHCGADTERQPGSLLWPGRPDLADAVMWNCRFCDAWVGSTAKGKPAGTAANAELRDARKKMGDRMAALWESAHEHPAYASAADLPGGTPEWRQARAIITGAARTRVWRFLGHRLGVEPLLAHASMMTLETCRKAWVALRGVTYDDVRTWNEANPPPPKLEKTKHVDERATS